MQILKC